MPGIPADFPKPTILVHPPMYFDTQAAWEARNSDYLRVATAFFGIFADAKSDSEVRIRTHHVETRRGSDHSDWLYSTSLYTSPWKIGKSAWATYTIYRPLPHAHQWEPAAELFALKSKRYTSVVVQVGDESIDLAQHSEQWSFNGTTYARYGSLLNGAQRAIFASLSKKCMPVVTSKKHEESLWW